MSPPRAVRPPLPRVPTYTADAVFDGLAADILQGALAAGEPVPAERLLAERFGASKLLVRQAIHRLAELGLVRARQGAVARVGDVGEIGDVRVIELFYRLAPDSPRARDLARDVLEKQHTQGLSLLEVCARRSSPAAREALAALAAGADARSEEAFAAFEQAFWTEVAIAGKNRILLAEVRFWYGELPARPAGPRRPPLGARRAFYLELARRLREGEDVMGYYLSTLRPSLDALFAVPGRRPPATGRAAPGHGLPATARQATRKAPARRGRS